MGVMSRRVVPACGNLCFFCPAMRARSRQPVKRYKKLLADIFPRSQDVEPNDRKIVKLCEYASKNPLRIPKISEYLEQRFYKEMRVEHFGSVKVVLCIYRNLLSSCKEQKPLFACSLLGIIRTLLDEIIEDEMRILACTTLVQFLNSEMDSTYMFNLEGVIPKLYEMAREVGDDERALRLRSSSLQALASMIWFMGEQSHIAMDFDKMISVILENYMDELGGEHQDEFKNPSYWSRLCLRNMAKVPKEASTIRRVFEPLFHNFDTENNWSVEKGLAYSVLTYMQQLLVETGLNSHLLLSMLVKHLDHKNIPKPSQTQIDIVKLVTLLTKNAKQEASLAIIGAISDLVKHLRKHIQYSSPDGDESDKCNIDLHSAIEHCILKLTEKVGDSGPILDTMAVVLENIGSNSVVARATISALYRTALIISNVPNLTYHEKAFPDALFHQLLLAMAHSDHETRTWAHRILSVILLPARVFPEHSKELQCNWKDVMIDGKVAELPSIRLNGHQIHLLLSAIWLQATSNENTPSNYESMAQTYQLSLFFIRYKSSRHILLSRCFQLALSLRSVSLDQEGGLQPSRRRSLFTMSSFMIVSAARAGNLQEVILGDEMVDPYLKVVGDGRLQAAVSGLESYGSQEDEIAAEKSLSVIKLDEKPLKELVAFKLVSKFQTILSEDELSDIKKEIVLNGFSLEDAYPLGVGLFTETPRLCSPLAQIIESKEFDEVLALSDDEDFFEDSRGSGSHQSGRKTSMSINSLDILSVNQLLDSVLETARQVASFPVSSVPVSYNQVKNQCEALVTSKQQKMSVLQNLKLHEEEENKEIVIFEEQPKQHNKIEVYNENDLKLIQHEQVVGCSVEYAQHSSFRLPPASPYDKFLRAARC
ncbi:protein SEMI-ROLLED LEAF 2-like [Impatiens glandulifera]|uniref:protein SEMI-ROLLED LEAF 2-like n=1 Tax=Impatiens glandulifera TaxID=253017 RepID=UPI001FB12AC0|nr:protein SEMI-ROLLED LEAF 2-like [Impatiens glandulifera]